MIELAARKGRQLAGRVAGAWGRELVPSGEHALRVTGLSCSYGPVRAVHDVSFHVAPGEAVALLGANGAGKSTVLNTIAGLLRPAAGRIEFAGVDTTGAPTHQVLRLGIALVPEGRQILVRQTVEGNLRLARLINRDRGNWDDDLAFVLDTFPILKTKFHQAAGELSGGQQQMLAIGRAILANPRLLLLDEPSLGLAPALMQDLTVRIQELRRARGLSLLLVEQNVFMASLLTERACIMQTGRIVATEESSKLLGRSDILHAYLGERAPAAQAGT